MNTEISNGLSLIVDALRQQSRNGIAIVDSNLSHGGSNLWGHLYMIVPHNRELAEQVRRAFLNKSPQEAATLVEKIRRDQFAKEILLAKTAR